MDGDASLPYTVKPEKASAIIFGALGLLITAGIVFGLGSRVPAWGLLLFCAAVWLFLGAFLAFLYTQRVMLLNDKLLYKKWFVKRQVAYASITSVGLERRVYQTRNGPQAHWLIEINSTGTPPVVIETKPFSRDGMVRVVDTIGAHTMSSEVREQAQAARTAIYAAK